MKLWLVCIVIGFYLLQPEFVEKMIWVDDFESSALNFMPDGWSGRKDEARQYYQVAIDTAISKEQFLSAINNQTDMFILKKIEIDIVKYPYLNWSWRVHQLPLNGDESQKKTCDVAASMNVVLVAKKWRPRSIKYSWSSTLEKHSVTKSPFAFWPSRCDIIVLQSGDEKLGEWVSEKRNVLEDYKQLYKKKKVKSKVIQAIVIMSDGDNTKSVSSADYDDIFFSKE